LSAKCHKQTLHRSKQLRYSIASSALASASADVEAERFSGHKKSLRRRRGESML
jgi:hypothetical protein